MYSNIDYYRQAVSLYFEQRGFQQLDPQEYLRILCSYTTYAPINLETAPKIEYAYRLIFQMQGMNWRDKINDFPESCFLLSRTDKRYGLNEGEEPTKVYFRAATEFQNELHEKYIELLLEKWEQTEKQRAINIHEEVLKTTPELRFFRESAEDWKHQFIQKEMRWFDIFLTLIDSNILQGNEKLFLSFEVKGKSYLGLSDEEYNTNFSSLPDYVCEEIYEKMLEMNPWWRL